jgi:predicted short-subunit dehydrogenase-like oxidoreductase (DUF2520 family)
VFASNFPVVLAMLAERLFGLAAIDATDARPTVDRLMRVAVDNLAGRPPVEALTGPVARGDVDTVRRHLAALARDRTALGAYRALTRAAVEELERAGDRVDRRLAELNALLA